MKNNILYLFGNELRKSKHDYMIVAVVQSLIWIASYIVSIVKYNNLYVDVSAAGLDLGTGTTVVTILDMQRFGITILAVSVIYAAFIWMREYTSGHKSIYTIMMLPQERHHIFIVKFLNAVTMFYMNLILFIAITILVCIVAPFVMKGGVFINPFTAMMHSSLATAIYMPMTFRNLLVTDVLIVAANTSLIALAFLINRFCMYKSGFAKFISVVVSISLFVFMLFMSFILVYETEVIYMAVISIVVGYFGSKYILQRLEF